MSKLRSLPGIPRRIGLDLRGDRLFFAEATLGPRGPRFGRVGCERPREGESLEELLARVGGTRWLRHAEVVLAIRHPELRIQRLDLPALSSRDARGIANRRAIELGASLAEPACIGFAVSPGKGPRPAWLAACPEEFARFANRRWAGRGVSVARFVSLQYSLGSLSRLLPPPQGGQLRAFLDLADGFSTCVLADSSGWVFSRELSIKVIGESSASEDGIDMFERLTTELRRTFHYVAAELRIGEVGELYLSGDAENFADLQWRLEQALGVSAQELGEVGIGDVPPGFDSAATCALGLLYAPDTTTSNLLPPEVKRAHARKVTRRRLAIAACVPAALLLTSGAHLGVTLSSLRDRSAALESTWHETKSERAEAEAVAAMRDRGRELDATVEELSTPQPPWSRALESLGRLLPGDAVLDRVYSSFDERWMLVLHIEFRGEDLASAAAAASQFSAALDDSPLFRVRGSERSEAPGRPDETFVRVRIRFDAEIAESEPASGIASRRQVQPHG